MFHLQYCNTVGTITINHTVNFVVATVQLAIVVKIYMPLVLLDASICNFICWRHFLPREKLNKR